MKYLLLLLSAVSLLMACGPSDIPEEPTEVTPEVQAQMDEYRTLFSEVMELLPAEDEEEAFDPETPIKDLGKNKFMESTRDNRVFSVEEDYLASIAKDGKENEALRKSGEAWLSTGDWDALDAEPLKDHKMFTPKHERAMNFFSDMKHLVVIRWKYYVSGKLDGDEIIKPGQVGIWLWVVDLESKELMACKELDLVTDDSFYVFDSSGNDSDIINHMRSKTKRVMNETLNEWASTSEVDYIRNSVY